MTGHLDHLVGTGQGLDAVLLLATGLAMSLGHCVGMCGPLVGALAGAQRGQGLSTRRVAVAHLLHHAGRITTYALIGFLLALAGTAVRRAGPATWVQGGLALGMGSLMILIALGLFGWLPTRRLIESGRLALAIGRLTRGLHSARGPAPWFLLGLANGLLPCGPVYAVAAAAVTADPLTGAAAMLLFGLGTVPALMLFALGVARVGAAAQHRFNRLAAVFVLVIGVQLLCRGAAALGWIGHLQLGPVVLW